MQRHPCVQDEKTWMIELIESQDGGSGTMSMRNQAAFLHKRARYLPELLRPGKILGRWMFVSLMVLASLTMLTKVALLNSLQKSEKSHLIIQPTVVVDDSSVNNVVKERNYGDQESRQTPSSQMIPALVSEPGIQTRNFARIERYTYRQANQLMH
ncbi:hypothetical protein GH714_036713 [Hevea brasiliensis]|uniref:Uncharacterized protein n=1 Tax=Hevea brasiliensis TaxID=3981 RepID=A0A6A6L5E0_HEVBR|nr:hypothetical protein GH714_036713 [Hevea brasiliensis]